MDSDQIREMFKANAALKSMSFIDPKRKALEDTFEALTRQYESEYFEGQFVSAVPSKMDIQDAFNVIASACQTAMSLELKHRPNGMTDEQICGLAELRKMAIDRLIEEFQLQS